jgi:hypothetical protein
LISGLPFFRICELCASFPSNIVNPSSVMSGRQDDVRRYTGLLNSGAGGCGGRLGHRTGRRWRAQARSPERGMAQPRRIAATPSAKICVPSTLSSSRVSSDQWWLMPLIDGTNNMAAGMARARIWASWPAVLGIRAFVVKAREVRRPLQASPENPSPRPCTPTP